MTDQPHPLRCLTCKSYDWFCKITGDELGGEFEIATHEKYGCASHSSRPAPALDVLLNALEKCKRYPSELGDMYLASDLESELRK